MKALTEALQECAESSIVFVLPYFVVSRSPRLTQYHPILTCTEINLQGFLQYSFGDLSESAEGPAKERLGPVFECAVRGKQVKGLAPLRSLVLQTIEAHARRGSYGPEISRWAIGLSGKHGL